MFLPLFLAAAASHSYKLCLFPPGTSYLNRTEAAAVEKVVTRFLQNGLAPHQVGSGGAALGIGMLGGCGCCRGAGAQLNAHGFTRPGERITRAPVRQNCRLSRVLIAVLPYRLA